MGTESPMALYMTEHGLWRNAVFTCLENRNERDWSIFGEVCRPPLLHRAEIPRVWRRETSLLWSHLRGGGIFH